MINIALLGTWHVHFDRYASQARDGKYTEVKALWDPDEKAGKAAAEKFNCEFVSDLDTILARTDIDAVIVCTSTDLHKEVIIKAANAKKHIFTEKVLCFNEKDAIEAADAIKANGVKFTISFPWKCRSDFQWLKNAVDEGLFGKITYCRMRNAHNGASAGWLPDSFFDKATCGGGAMMDLGAHSMYILNWIMGRADKAASAFTNVMVKTVEDNAVTVLTYPDGAIGVSETGFVSQNNPFEFELSGTKGTALMGGFLDKPCYNVGSGWIFPSRPSPKPDPIDQWAEAIANGTEAPFGTDEAIELSRIMELAYANVM